MVSPKTPRRAKGLAELLEIAKFFMTGESYEAGMAFQPRPSDIIISPCAKSGTTWLQQITHGLRTRGSMDFEQVTDVVPWLEFAHDLNYDLKSEHLANPRVFKSHLGWDRVPKGARYIYSVRHPYDTAVSFFRFLEGWWFETGSIPLDVFIRDRVIPNQGYWYHIVTWWEQRENENILFLCFEDMKEDLLRTVQVVAQFMGIVLDDDLLDIVVRQSSKEFMLAHKSQFTGHRVQKFFEQRGGASIAPDSGKVTTGTPNDERYQLSPELKEEFDAIWHDIIYQRFGLADYAALRTAIANLPR